MLQVCGPDLFEYIKQQWKTKGQSLFDKIIKGLLTTLDALKDKATNKLLDNSLLIYPALQASEN